jgi:septal ring factor EnvC (AmiA/AmiB activator)|tara:strand:+ start:412 stop:702 length:291 start_codon:yes stop_codon:yes gene_type:complete
MKIFKWIFALIAGIGGILAMMLVPAGNKRKKIKVLNKKIKAVDEEIKNTNKKQKNLKKTLKSKKKVLEEIKEKKYKKKDVSTKEASDFLKNFSKEK